VIVGDGATTAIDQPKKTHDLDVTKDNLGSPICCEHEIHSVAFLKAWNHFGQKQYHDGAPWRANKCMLCHKKFVRKHYKSQYSAEERKTIFFVDDDCNPVYGCKGAMEDAHSNCPHVMCNPCYTTKRDAASPRKRSRVHIHGKSQNGGGKVLSKGRRNWRPKSATCSNLMESFSDAA